ncbi:unnamed protein product [Tuber aestivum]|uniref:Anaphase-promoting complex subunit 4 WD40 domain-containing protein n=1 Tax=Tuber aestivum TaxID=59557 RepID=A0A292Q133_9PEZI|nr:unnamed protein product [Tuber aestivum]
MGQRATGDNSGKMIISTRKEGITCAGMWSPNERHVFASASLGGTVKITDSCAKTNQHQLSVNVSSSDINVASWCRAVTHLLATGSGDGQPITNSGFWPTEDGIVAVVSTGSTITLWDVSVELGDNESKDTGGMEDILPQLLFVH